MQYKLYTHSLLLDGIDRYVHEFKAMTMHKLLTVLCLSGFLFAAQKFIETYLFHDWNYFVSLFILITVDTITGVMKAFKQGVLSSNKFGRLLIKIILYCLTLIVVNVLISFKIDGSHPHIFDWIEVFLFNALIFREAISVFENIAIIYPSLLPAFVMKKLEMFDASGLEIKEEDSIDKATEEKK